MIGKIESRINWSNFSVDKKTSLFQKINLLPGREVDQFQRRITWKESGKQIREDLSRTVGDGFELSKGWAQNWGKFPLRHSLEYAKSLSRGINPANRLNA